ncbi:hypothetical protein CAOG_08611 [Capsaspora owczarzaki ATCC 30864]|uniref:Gamma-glutamyltransferase n=1 Tax=Capsaspora owczarzaki (strain ATCC 30864) TaxID=595528 RepID=A0A0D2WLC4_CAPO3|nr:hypothetical protein CAOG_08611 [Capsaspora owczarzaki ATCC 30864]KJE91355.1 hypothetical protein CAOG_008611 [Capsaspora owczarzaki ATCC 30864]|eukprot:XP_011270211.1 hypothetical protein CAOG_08611 [Capsaspora owczarzaki ATCC 30864]
MSRSSSGGGRSSHRSTSAAGDDHHDDRGLGAAAAETHNERASLIASSSSSSSSGVVTIAPDSGSRRRPPRGSTASSSSSSFVSRLFQFSRRKVFALLLVLAVILAVVGGLGYFSSSSSSSQPIQFQGHGAVAADSTYCSEIGADILRQNGSAVDAAIASLLCIGVVNSHSSGIGGGGFMVVHTNDTDVVIDFREVAPAAAYVDMFKNSSQLSQVGGLSAGVPGELAGMAKAHEMFGILPWAKLFAPAIKLAREGFVLNEHQAAAITSELTYVRADPGLRAVFIKANGDPLAAGDVCIHANLANTLEAVATNGIDIFYNGSIAHQIVDDINANGGNMTYEDFANYRPVIRQPLVASYNGFKLVTAPPPASGGVTISVLNILDGFVTAQTKAQETARRHLYSEQTEPGPMQPRSLLAVQRTTEAFKFGYALRTRIADPFDTEYADDIAATLAEMQNVTEALNKRFRIHDNETFDPEYYGAIYDVEPTRGTTHLSVLGTRGDAVAVTSTINTYFGAKFTSPSNGVILNDEMDDFSSPNITNAYGVPPSPANFIKPGKRPLSSSAPTIVFNAKNEVYMVVGASGGTRITTSTIQVMQSVLTFGEGIDDAITRPRLHHQLLPNILMLEPAFPTNLYTGMQAIGHNVTTSTSIAVVQGIVQYAPNVIYAKSDPRKGGEAVVF